MPEPQLVPVDHDPFAGVPPTVGSGGVSLVPVDHDPFEDAAARVRSRYGRMPVGDVPVGTSDVLDTVASVPYGVVGGLANTIALGGTAAAIEGGHHLDVPALDKDTGRALIEENLTGPLHHPQTRAGRYGESVGEVLGNPANYVAPGSLLSKVLWNAASGISSEAGGQLYEGQPGEQLARSLAAWGPGLTERVANSGFKFVPQGSSAPVQTALQQFGFKARPDELRAYDDALLAALHDKGPMTLPKQPPNPTGADIYTQVGLNAGGYGRGARPVASGALNEAGIPGIKYLDQGSRGAGGVGTSNYVVFNDKLIDILRKYGVAGLSLLPPAIAADVSRQFVPVDHDPFAQ